MYRDNDDATGNEKLGAFACSCMSLSICIFALKRCAQSSFCSMREFFDIRVINILLENMKPHFCNEIVLLLTSVFAPSRYTWNSSFECESSAACMQIL
jgi:hypothetical protein